mgnify:FL=1|jgi:hypothetical protein
MIKKYKCIKNLCIEIRDDDGFSTGKYDTVQKDTIWQEDPYYMYRTCSGPKIVRLESVDPQNSYWLEIAKEDLESYFEAIE